MHLFTSYFTQCASDQKSEKLGKKDPQKMTVDVSSIKQFFYTTHDIKQIKFCKKNSITNIKAKYIVGLI